MRVNEGRVETLFGGGTVPSLAIQLNNDDGLSLFCREGGAFTPFPSGSGHRLTCTS